MKKYSLITAILSILVVSVFFQKQVRSALFPEAPVSKQIQLAIFTQNNYSAAVYEQAKASVHVTVTKLKGKSRYIVWEKTFEEMALKKYPTVHNAFTQQVTVPNIIDGKEKLLITYTVTYEAKGSVLKLGSGTMVSKGVMSDKLQINI